MRFNWRRKTARAAAATACLGLGLGAAAAGLAGAAPAAAASAAAPASAHAASATQQPQPVFGNPYYLASPSGAVWPLGGAPGYGSLAGDRLNAPIVGMTVTPDGHGYWLVASDGGVFSFGDAHFYGSTGAVHLAKPVIGMAATPDGHGYWLYAADGGIFTFGDAHFYGSTGAVHLARPIVGMAPSADGNGYWLVGGDGGVFSFGDAAFEGTLAGSGLQVASIVDDPNGPGYWEVTHDGDVYPFGSAAGDQVPLLALMHTIEGPGDVAMEWAMAQIGKPYQWGGAGPNSFDCSGLVMRAWQAAGVNIPRVAADQFNFGTHVAIADLHIGDLVFWATNPSDPATIEHVAMYIGGDHMVNAPHTGTDVRTDWIGGSGFVGLGTRP